MGSNDGSSGRMRHRRGTGCPNLGRVDRAGLTEM